MILIFDLDDTLYDERCFVDGGFRAVAEYGNAVFGWNADDSFHFMTQVLDRKGRGHVFDAWLEEHGKLTRRRIRECVNVYRHHRPELTPFPGARSVLDRYRDHAPLYLVTDGHKIVQRNKVDALELWHYFRWVMITHRFGRHNAKPSTYCFERIREKEDCMWSDMVYVGDNPAKDFVNLNGLGVVTVRVLTGIHRNTIPDAGYEARFTICDLGELPELLARVGGEVAH